MLWRPLLRGRCAAARDERRGGSCAAPTASSTAFHTDFPFSITWCATPSVTHHERRLRRPSITRVRVMMDGAALCPVQGVVAFVEQHFSTKCSTVFSSSFCGWWPVNYNHCRVSVRNNARFRVVHVPLSLVSSAVCDDGREQLSCYGCRLWGASSLFV